MPSQASTGSAHRRLLVIEPDAQWRETIIAVGGWYFSDVVAVADVLAGAQRLTAAASSVVIAEHELPSQSGLVLYDRFRRHDPALVFVLTSSDLRVALSDPNFRYLRKPFQREELSALFRSITRPE